MDKVQLCGRRKERWWIGANRWRCCCGKSTAEIKSPFTTQVRSVSSNKAPRYSFLVDNDNINWVAKSIKLPLRVIPNQPHRLIVVITLIIHRGEYQTRAEDIYRSYVTCPGWQINYVFIAITPSNREELWGEEPFGRTWSIIIRHKHQGVIEGTNK